MNLENLKNKKILLLGFGVENIALAKYLAHHGVRFSIADKKSRGEVQDAQELNDLPIDEFQGGENYLDGLVKFDIIFRSPGVPYLDSKIQQAIKGGVIVTSQIKYFFENCPAYTIGVTGTKGKGTTSTLIYEILKKSKVESLKSKVYLAGNIGKAPIEFLDQLTKDDIVVLELSSFQLQDLGQSPNIAVILDIKVDHLDIHKNREEYIEAKTNIVKYQKKEDFAVINADYLTSVEFAAMTKAQVYWFSRRKSVDQGAWVKNSETIYLRENVNDREISKTKDLTLRGEHNWENICAASLAAHLVGASLETIKNVVEKFPGLEHRLEFVREINGIKFYNDSFSTTSDTAIAAIKSFSQPIILIAGGSEKNADYKELGQAIDGSTVKTAILIGVTGPRIKSEIRDQNIEIISNCQNIQEVIDTVKDKAKSGDVVLLSPASASFDWFNNYKERGKLFKEKVNAWQ